MTDAQLTLLMDRLGYVFQDVTLLQQALVHRSVGAAHNERLEFLGDAALSLAVATDLFQRDAVYSEGDMTQMRSALVCGDALTALAKQLDLADLLHCAPSEKKRASVLEDALEAIIGAVFCDGGFAAVQQCIAHCFVVQLADIKPSKIVKDAKTQLQEYLQGQGKALPTYEVDMSGPAHERRFRAECHVKGCQSVQGEWCDSRRSSEKSAAQIMLEKINDK